MLDLLPFRWLDGKISIAPNEWCFFLALFSTRHVQLDFQENQSFLECLFYREMFGLPILGMLRYICIIPVVILIKRYVVFVLK